MKIQISGTGATELLNRHKYEIFEKVCARGVELEDLEFDGDLSSTARVQLGLFVELHREQSFKRAFEDTKAVLQIAGLNSCDLGFNGVTIRITHLQLLEEAELALFRTARLREEDAISQVDFMEVGRFLQPDDALYLAYALRDISGKPVAFVNCGARVVTIGNRDAVSHTGFAP